MGEFETFYAVGSDIGSGIREKRKQRRFEEAYSSGDLDRAGLIDPDRLKQQQALKEQRAAAESAQNGLRQQAALRAAQAVRNLAKKTGDYRAAADLVVSKSGGLFGSSEELAGVVDFIGENGEEGLSAIEASFGPPQKAGQRFISTAGGLYDTETGAIVEGTTKPVAPRDPLDDAYRRSQIEANRALVAQRQKKLAGDREAAVGADEIVLDAPKELRARATFGAPGINKSLDTLEQVFSGGNVLDDTPRNKAASVAAAIPFDGGYFERVVGDDRRDAAIQASNAYNNTVLPIISGQAVTESEAKRQVRAAIPQPGDSVETLEAKRVIREGHRRIVNAIVTGEPIKRADVGLVQRATGKVLSSQPSGTAPELREGSGLSPEEQAELDALRAELGGQ